MSIVSAYQRRLLRDGHVADPAQKAVVVLLDELQSRLKADAARSSNPLRRLFGHKKTSTGVRGVYLWGSVGRGKTFLMDLFFESLAVKPAQRIHFHRMMQDVHRRLKELPDVQDPLDHIAADIAASARVLCFDEFFVSDIGDAMILARLLEGLFRRGVTLVATSNLPPDQLYRDGLQRQRFLPAIDLLATHTQVVQIAGDTDHRLRLLQQAGTYICPADARAKQKLKALFDESASSHIQEHPTLQINGRGINAARCAKGIVWFEFDEICDGPRSTDDYIEIARWYPSVIVSSVPCFERDTENQARRFIALVDEFYDRRVKLIVSSDYRPAELYNGAALEFEFERTVSRLVEMQTDAYLRLPHLA